jgi:hypothetical protein
MNIRSYELETIKYKVNKLINSQQRMSDFHL